MERQVKLLVVDDDLLFRRLWRRIAEELGLETLEAGDPEHAWKLLESFEPDVLVLDVLFPEGKGTAVEFLRQLRQEERWRSLPVLVCSALGQREVVLQLAQEGISAYLLKPFTLEQARERLRQLLRAHGLVSEAPGSEQP